jgi:hypothetical protein
LKHVKYSLHDRNVISQKRLAKSIRYPAAQKPAGVGLQNSVSEKAEGQKGGVLEVNNVEMEAAIRVGGEHEVLVIEISVAEDEFSLESDLWRVRS